MNPSHCQPVNLECVGARRPRVNSGGSRREMAKAEYGVRCERERTREREKKNLKSLASVFHNVLT